MQCAIPINSSIDNGASMLQRHHGNCVPNCKGKKFLCIFQLQQLSRITTGPKFFLHVSIWLRETLGVKFPEKSFFLHSVTACSSSVYLKITYSFVLQAKIRNRRKSGSKLLSSSKVGSYTHNYLILHSIGQSF